MVHVSNFTYGPVTPVLGFVMSSLGCFLGLRAATRARASHGARRVRWLLLATVSIATTGIWVMHFVAMLGFTIPGQTITYSVPVTMLVHADRGDRGRHRLAHRRASAAPAGATCLPAA